MSSNQTDLKILQSNSNILSVGINTLLIIIMILLLRVIITIKSTNSMSSKQLVGIKLVICIQEVHHHFQPGSIRLQEVIDLHLIIIHTHPGKKKPPPPPNLGFLILDPKLAIDGNVRWISCELINSE